MPRLCESNSNNFCYVCGKFSPLEKSEQAELQKFVGPMNSTAAFPSFSCDMYDMCHIFKRLFIWTTTFFTFVERTKQPC